MRGKTSLANETGGVREKGGVAVKMAPGKRKSRMDVKTSFRVPAQRARMFCVRTAPQVRPLSVQMVKKGASAVPTIATASTPIQQYLLLPLLLLLLTLLLLLLLLTLLLPLLLTATLPRFHGPTRSNRYRAV